MPYLPISSKFILILILILIIFNNQVNAYYTFTTEITFNLYAKTSILEEGIKFDYKQYSIYITYLKINNSNYSIIKQMVSKEISDKNNLMINKIYLLSQNQLGLAVEKYLKENNSIYIEFPDIKILHNFNLYLYYNLNNNLYLKLGIDNFNFNSSKIQPVIGFYFEY